MLVVGSHYLDYFTAATAFCVAGVNFSSCPKWSRFAVTYAKFTTGRYVRVAVGFATKFESDGVWRMKGAIVRLVARAAT